MPHIWLLQKEVEGLSVQQGISTIVGSLKHCTVLKLNSDEVPVVSELAVGEVLGNQDFVNRITEAFDLDLVIITDGAKGCYIFKEGALHHSKGEQVAVKDTIGAGDAFCAAFMFVYCQGGGVKEAASIANRIGGFVASQAGAIPKYTQVIKDLINPYLPRG